MIDGAGFYVNGSYAETLWNNHLLKSKDVKEYEGLIIKKTKCGCHVSGSLHKFWNHGLHNCDDYTHQKFCNTLVRLHSELGINPEITTFHGIEFGVNIQLPYGANEFIQRVAMYSDKKKTAAEKEKHGIRVHFDDFEIKVYDKTAQSPMYALPNTMRFEVVIKRSERMRKKLIDDNTTVCRMLSDLAKIEIWNDLHREILRCYDALVIYDIDVQSLQKEHRISDEDARLLIEGKDIAYWDKLKGMKRKRAYDRFTKLLFEHSSGMKAKVRELISDKIDHLCDTENVTKYKENVTKYTKFQSVEIERNSESDVTKYTVDEGVYHNTPISENPQEWTQEKSGIDQGAKIGFRPVSELMKSINELRRSNSANPAELRKIEKTLTGYIRGGKFVDNKFFDAVLQYLGNKELRTRVYELCAERGITTGQLSERAGLYFPVVSRAANMGESCGTKTGFETLMKLASGLDVHVWELFYVSKNEGHSVNTSGARRGHKVKTENLSI